MTTRTAQAAALADRLTRLRARLEQEGLDAMFATSRPAVIYLTGFPDEGFERLIATLVTREATYLIIPSLERETAEEDALGVELAVWADGEDAIALVVSLLSGVSSGPIRLGAEEHSLSLAQADRLKRDLPGQELAHAGGLIADTRLRKDEAEVDHMRAAAGLLAAGLEAAYENASAGTSEVELQGLLELELKRLGG
ncbi:MAG: aminopeptidase P family N-terminal domain-containing protein [Actinomycetia bacterium]|nr:aminopeptidase P family N-terminal domain-containing protein [Actinomycetes bacterium]